VDDGPGPGHPDASALRFDRVGKRFDNDVQALAGVDLRISPGEFVSVVGPSGCGKTTLLRLAAGLSQPSDGHIELRSDRIAYVFQDATLLPWRDALANVQLVLELDGQPEKHSKQQRRAKALAALATVGLSGFERQLPARLSGGMRMRVSLARALVLEPELFLFDEPFGALDEITRLRMQEELQRLVYNGTFTTLFITHSVPEAVYLSNRVVVMSARPGTLVAEVAVPFDYPRPAALRFDPAFTRIAAQVSDALATAMTGADR
jgi:NitT/TauT family transport system ATP-binding protein